jgi:hypothetical protein
VSFMRSTSRIDERASVPFQSRRITLARDDIA